MAGSAKPARPSTGATTVDEYLSNVDEPARAVLTKLRAQIMGAAPMAREVISYHIPTYLHHGPLLHFAAWPKHLALYAVSPASLKAFKEELKPFRISGRTLHFWAEKPLPASLVKKIVKQRVKENAARSRS